MNKEQVNEGMNAALNLTDALRMWEMVADWLEHSTCNTQSAGRTSSPETVAE